MKIRVSENAAGGGFQHAVDKKKVLGPTSVDQRTSLSYAISIKDSLLRLRCPWKSWR
ncbi:MAG: hypothetical protein LZF62_440077 [Nitrospira sp.]|nr:MAG: hypothetical protein LZF62_440077 [Nitrospira sp.]